MRSLVVHLRCRILIEIERKVERDNNRRPMHEKVDNINNIQKFLQEKSFKILSQNTTLDGGTDTVLKVCAKSVGVCFARLDPY